MIVTIGELWWLIVPVRSTLSSLLIYLQKCNGEERVRSHSFVTDISYTLFPTSLATDKVFAFKTGTLGWQLVVNTTTKKIMQISC